MTTQNAGNLFVLNTGTVYSLDPTNKTLMVKHLFNIFLHDYDDTIEKLNLIIQ